MYFFVTLGVSQLLARVLFFDIEKIEKLSLVRTNLPNYFIDKKISVFLVGKISGF